MIVNVQFTCWAGQWRELTEADYARLREVVPSLPAKKNEHEYGDHLCDDIALRMIASLGLNVELKSAPESCMLVRLQDRLRELGERVSDAEAATKGAIVQVHIPDLFLLKISEVTYRDDCCTDALQDLLDDGWHILAVCPPNAKRRPDYILGRVKPRE